MITKEKEAEKVTERARRKSGGGGGVR